MIQGLDENMKIEETVGKSIQRIVNKNIASVEYKWFTIVIYSIASHVAIALILY